MSQHLSLSGMAKTLLFRIIYKRNVNLHKITNAVESVQGARIRRLNLISKGKKVVGTIAVEVSQLIDFDQIMLRIRKNRGISMIERISDVSCS
jgi:hypothetical protein